MGQDGPGIRMDLGFHIEATFRDRREVRIHGAAHWGL